MDGWIILDKPLGLGSTQAVGAVKRALREGGYGKRKVGHGGTLDPLATGCCRSRWARRPSSPGGCSTATRSMTSRSAFGVETDTLDLEGKAVAASEALPTLDQIEAVLPRFTGPIEQVPPAYSALKVGGERAYDLARAGEDVVLASRSVTIHALHLSSPARGGGPPQSGGGGGLATQASLAARPLHQPAAGPQFRVGLPPAIQGHAGA